MAAQATLAALNSIARSLQEVLKTLREIEQKQGAGAGKPRKR